MLILMINTNYDANEKIPILKNLLLKQKIRKKWEVMIWTLIKILILDPVKITGKILSQKEIELKELEKRIDSIKKSHELELKNIETMAKFMAVEFFNKKGEEINRLYSNEVIEIYKAYDEIRVKFFYDEKKLA